MNFDKDEFDAFMYEVDAVSKQVFRIIIFFQYYYSSTKQYVIKIFCFVSCVHSLFFIGEGYSFWQSGFGRSRS